MVLLLPRRHPSQPSFIVRCARHPAWVVHPLDATRAPSLGGDLANWFRSSPADTRHSLLSSYAVPATLPRWFIP
jgi:hypothetical protein